MVTPAVALTLLVLSLVAYAVGPVLYGIADRARATLAALDGFVMVAVAGVALVHIIPEGVAISGPVGVAVALVGFLGPGMLEHRLEGSARQAHTAALILALGGLCLHVFFDGVGLASAFYAPGQVSILAVAVLLHRIPIAVTIWWLVRPARGPRAAALVLTALGASTVLGYAMTNAVAGVVDARWLGLLECLIAGSLLHVVVHRPSPLITPSDSQRERLLAGIGALVGLAAVVALVSQHQIPLHPRGSIGFGRVFTTLSLESAPALLIAFALAGLVQVLLPRASLRWMRTGRRGSEAVRGVVFGLPLPICSCGVIPLYQTLVTQAVPASAAMAFLVATPELGIDSVLISLPLLGGAFTLVRITCATAVALMVGVALGRMADAGRSRLPEARAAALDRPHGLMARMRAGLSFGFGEVVDHTAPWIVLGIAIASLADPVLRGSWIAALPWGTDVVLFALLGMPTYVCASGATPLVAVLLAKGVSPGAALAFLLTGPATNATTFGVLSRLHGPRVALRFGAMMASLAVGLGFAVNLVLPHVHGISLYQAAAEGPSAIQVASLAAMAVVLALSVLRQGPRGFVGQILTPYGGGGHRHGHDHGEGDGGDHGTPAGERAGICCAD